jgi:hypothetical protein
MASAVMPLPAILPRSLGSEQSLFNEAIEICEVEEWI